MDQSRMVRRGQTVDYKRLAGLVDDPHEADTEPGCCLCDQPGHIRKSLPNGQSISSFLKDFHTAEDLSHSGFETSVLCVSCFDVCTAIARLQKELQGAKDQLRQIISENKEIILDEVSVSVVEAGEAPSPTEASIVLRVTPEELEKLDLQLEVQSSISSRKLQKINAKCSLLNGSLVIQGHPSDEGKSESKKGLLCQSCDASFSSLDSLLQHLKQSSCKTEIRRGNATAKENQIQASNKQFKCDTCNKMFTRKASMLEHCARHKGLRERECKICQKKFYSTSYWRHMSTVHAQNEKLTHQCSVCDRKFAQKYKLLLHEKSHVSYEQREYVCTQCPDEKRFATRNRFKTHEKQVHESGDGKSSSSKLCSECGMVFTTTASLSAHRKRHHSPSAANKEYYDSSIQCNECFISFSSSEELQRHSLSVHESSGSRISSHECSWCGLQFSSLSEFDAHAHCCQQAVIPSAEIVGHEEIVQQDFDGAEILQEAEHSSQTLLAIDDGQSGATLIISDDQSGGATMMLPSDATNSLFIPPYEVASQDFQCSQQPANNGLREELQKQLIGTNYSCQPCKKSFSTYKAKSQHERLVHPKGPLYSCNICERIFANNQYLRDHMKIHSNVKPFVCDYEGCGKPFRLGKDLIRHKRVHTGEKPFKCDVCGKCFSASSNLSEHRTLHSGLMPYECANCGKKFRLWSTMRKHANRCPLPSSKNATIMEGGPLLLSENGTAPPTVFVFDVHKGL